MYFPIVEENQEDGTTVSVRIAAEVDPDHILANLQKLKLVAINE